MKKLRFPKPKKKKGKILFPKNGNIRYATPTVESYDAPKQDYIFFDEAGLMFIDNQGRKTGIKKMKK